jgi:hypothetical protein
MKIVKYILILLVLSLSGNFICQSLESKLELKEGNDAYKKGDFKKSEASYKGSISSDETNLNAIYNNGNASFMSGDFESARENFNNYIYKSENIDDKSKAHYNIGNSYLTEYAKEMNEKGQPPSGDFLENAVNEYKKALRYNPKDKDARYNLSYAMKLIQNQQNQENKDQDKENKDQDKENKDQDKENKDQDKENKDQDKENKDQDKENKDQDKENKDQDKENNQDKENKEKKSETKEQALKNLDAINSDEEKVLLKVNRKKGDQKKKSKTKDW